MSSCSSETTEMFSFVIKDSTVSSAPVGSACPTPTGSESSDSGLVSGGRWDSLPLESLWRSVFVAETIKSVFSRDGSFSWRSSPCGTSHGGAVASSSGDDCEALWRDTSVLVTGCVLAWKADSASVSQTSSRASELCCEAGSSLQTSSPAKIVKTAGNLHRDH